MYSVVPGTTLSIMLPYTLGTDAAFTIADLRLEAVVREAYDAAGYTAEFEIDSATVPGYIALRLPPAQSARMVAGRRYDSTLIATQPDGEAFDLTPVCSARMRISAVGGTSDGLGDSVDPEGAPEPPLAPVLSTIAPGPIRRQGGNATVVIGAPGGGVPKVRLFGELFRLSAYRKIEDGVFEAVVSASPNATGWPRSATLDIEWGLAEAVVHVTQEA
jgi:hypothetical protein